MTISLKPLVTLNTSPSSFFGSALGFGTCRRTITLCICICAFFTFFLGCDRMRMGNFGSFMSGALGAVGAGAGVAAGIDPATGQAIGQALGGFADMVIGRMEVTSDVVDPNTGEKIIAPMMALFEQEFNDALKPALKAFEPFGKLVFYVATRLGLLLGKLSEALTPLIDLVGTLLMSVFQIFYIQIMAMVPLMAAYVSVLQLLSPVIEFLNQGIVLLGNAMAQFAIWVGWLINEFAKLIEDIPLIGEGLHAFNIDVD